MYRLGCLAPLSTIFQLYQVVSFIGGGITMGNMGIQFGEMGYYQQSIKHVDTHA
jgi:hypothetical protein